MKLAIVVGEDSGDQLGAALITALRRIRDDLTFTGVGGERMTAQGMASLFPVSDVAVMGIGSVVRHLPRIARRIGQTVDALHADDPDGLVIIDSPGFTHTVARRLVRRRPNLAVIDYVSPSVWAWRPGRAAKMARFIDHVLALLPFEPEAHRSLGGPPCTYVGHPLVERLDMLRGARADDRLPTREHPVVVVLPGSRATEVTRLLPVFGQTLELLAARVGAFELQLPAVEHLEPVIRTAVAAWPVRPEIITGEANKFAAFRRADVALAASGTVTLELALAGVPMVVAYKLDPVARRLKWLSNAASIVLPNLIVGENAIPEFIDEAATPEALSNALAALFTETPERSRQVAAFARLTDQMKLPGGIAPSEKAAQIVLETIARGKI